MNIRLNKQKLSYFMKSNYLELELPKYINVMKEA